MTVLEVLATGPLVCVQDLGRPGLGHLGVSDSGAADRRSHTLANRLVANPEDAATLEITLGGFAARVRGGTVEIAVTGADATPRVDGIALGHNSIARIRDGQLITLDTPLRGVRSYLAVRGGVDAEPVLGSRSYDTLARLGPPPLNVGDHVAVGVPGPVLPALDVAPVPPIGDGPARLRVLPGPRMDWLRDPAALTRSRWVVADATDRVGVRLDGPALAFRQPGRQLPSEGTVRGAVQVPPGGRPVILGADHPVTGGYPVVAVVADADTDLLAQLRPGQPVGLVELRA